MKTFPLLAAFTLCVSVAILCASFDELRAAPRLLQPNTTLMHKIAEQDRYFIPPAP